MVKTFYNLLQYGYEHFLEQVDLAEQLTSSDFGISTGLINQNYWKNSKWYYVNVERGNAADKLNVRTVLFGLWSMVFPDYVSIRRPPRAVNRMLDNRVGDRRRGRPRYSYMQAVQESWTCNWGLVVLVTSHRTRFYKMFLNTSARVTRIGLILETS